MNPLRTTLFLAMTFSAAAAVAQQGPPEVPFAMGVPVAPTGLQDQVLPPGPFRYRTAEQMDINVRVWARGLETPYAMAFLPNGDLLVTERTGKLRLVHNGVTDPKPIEGVPQTKFGGKSGGLGATHGLTGLAVHPQFAQNHLIYFAANRVLKDNSTEIAIIRARLENGALHDQKELLAGEGLRGTVALTMTKDGKLWVANGSGEDAQDPSKITGKVLRLNDDGTPAADNPFVGKAGYRPEIYTMGHRSTLGLTVNPYTNEVWLSEMGPNGGDEINVLRAGKNYGWPRVSLGRTYPGPWQSKDNIPTHEGFEPPVVYWTPAIAVAGLTFYTGDKLPKWTGNLFVGGLRYGEVPGTGRLDRVLLNPKGEELRRETLLQDLHQRIRDVKQGPDGLLYVATDEVDGVILVIEPAT
ncbi:MAG: PQQ-dependent sugar dehydrogenase [Nevskiaceae bacterium]|jgi:glucose/arabinose dehydrogenase|nr:PQQ-dependent sugar dehydrogenase [Nevskiaceae bacterium]